MEKKWIQNDQMLMSLHDHDPDRQPIRQQPADERDYSTFFSSKNINYKHFTPYLMVGNMPVVNSWLIHISVVNDQIEKVLPPLLDLLAKSDYPFVIPENSTQHNIILDGRSGLKNIGKVISISIQDESKIHEIVSAIIQLTLGFKGPEVVTAVHLSSCVSVTYGSFCQNLALYDSKYYSSIYGYDAVGEMLSLLKAQRITWPFTLIKPLKKNRIPKLFKQQYLPIQSLKNDPKGNVLQCIRLNRIYNMQWCVLKQGKKYQCHDEDGRDMWDRLSWQYTVHKLLEKTSVLPRAIEYFEYNDDGYLSLEFIDGISLNERFIELQQATIWWALSTFVKREIMKYLLQVIDILSTFHQNGLIHRDITPGNFLVTATGKVIAIDIELSYDSISESPSPPFMLGTPGYMSPQQAAKNKPVPQDDIYSLGALIVKAFTGLSPYKLSGRGERLREDLQYLTGSPMIASLICDCLSQNTEMRPDLQSVKNKLQDYETSLTTTPSFAIAALANEKKQALVNQTIQCAINGLGVTNLLGHDGEWLSKCDQTYDGLSNESLNRHWYPGWRSGVAGILHTLSLARRLGYDTEILNELIHRNILILEKETDNFTHLTPGFWHGSYGVAVALNTLIESGYLERNIFQINRIYQLVSKPSLSLNIADGIAGQGLGLLHFMGQPQFPKLDEQLAVIVSTLIQEQQPDGSWLLRNSQMPISKGLKVTGLCYGIAGITYFLLEHYSKFKNSDTQKAIIKSLQWFISQRKPATSLWTINTKNPNIDPWLEDGFSGVALIFIKAFEVLQDPVYKEVATDVLLNHPKFISSNYFTLANGLSGLGEVYLEAFRIFQEKEWLERADHIAEFLLHTYKKDYENTCFWLEGNYSTPTADLMTGNAGIIHFLVRYANTEKMDSGFNFNI